VKTIGEMSREELGGLICQTLMNAGIDAILSGGSCVSIWTEELYVSDDLDFILTGLESNRAIRKALGEVGFVPDYPGSRYYVHPEAELSLEFPPGPLAVGNEFIPAARAAQIETDTGVLKLLAPTDCVKDRLAGYYAWGDKQNFEQAVMVAQKHGVHWDNLEKWHIAEGESEKFEAFQKAVQADS
jgi:hypothetical protein